MQGIVYQQLAASFPIMVFCITPFIEDNYFHYNANLCVWRSFGLVLLVYFHLNKIHFFSNIYTEYKFVTKRDNLRINLSKSNIFFSCVDNSKSEISLPELLILLMPTRNFWEFSHTFVYYSILC